jgi:two-component sensor histidine kinase
MRNARAWPRRRARDATTYRHHCGSVFFQIDLPIDIAVPCGLMLNELITNAMRHAFPDRGHGEICIALTRQLGNEVLLPVSDNGIGLPDHLNTWRTETIGLQLVELLAIQLDGEISIHRSGPTQFSLRLPI